jgi:hypothetical protein
MKGTPIYQVWHGMKQRCLNPSAKGYKYWGGRGITICPSWVNSFSTFFADMSEGYASGLSLDRKDNSLGYCKSNCRWATITEQNNNRRSVVLVDGLSIAQTAKKLGAKESTIAYRVSVGKSLAEIQAPVHHYIRKSNSL